MKYAIYKTLDITAKDIDDCINNCTELEGIEVSLYSDGWIIAEPDYLHVEPWSRRKEDYRIETIDFDSHETVYDTIELIRD